MPPFATTVWARNAGLATARKAWEIRFHLLANGKHPTGISTSLRSTELWVMLSRDLFYVDISHDGKRDSIAVWRRQTQRTWNQLELPDPTLATFWRWIAGAEARFKKVFRRDKQWVQSNIKGGRDAVVTWIENGYRFES